MSSLCACCFLGLQVPTALLLERPLVMSSVLLDAYPCLRKARVHSMVSVSANVLE